VVSVVIPTRDRESFLPQAIESALAQGLLDLEVLVVDDGSTDGTERALRTFAGRIRTLRQEPAGAAAARNRGWTEARGEWIAFLDSDDWWEPHALERALEVAREDGAVGLVAFQAHRVRADGARSGRIFRKRSAGPYFTTASLLLGDAGTVLTPIVRRDLLERVSGFDETLVAASDCDLWLRLSFETRLRSVPEPLLNVRVHEGNTSRDKVVNARMWLRILDKLARARPELVRERGGAYRRALGKERLRLGRELLARAPHDATALPEARDALRASLRARPFARAYVYLAWSYLAPRTYGAWRAREERHRSGRP
jgi:glycosyltransferase involved in cell wall biosynthesis